MTFPSLLFHPSVVCGSGFFPEIRMISVWLVTLTAFLFHKCVWPLLKAVGFWCPQYLMSESHDIDAGCVKTTSVYLLWTCYCLHPSSWATRGKTELIPVHPGCATCEFYWLLLYPGFFNPFLVVFELFNCWLSGERSRTVASIQGVGPPWVYWQC